LDKEVKMSFEVKAFLQSALINTLALMPVIIGLVTLYGKMGIKGKWQLVASLVTGFVLGAAIQMAVVGFPQVYGDYIALLLFGLVPGLVASGVYETGKEIGTKAAKVIREG
jgi:hypothetical protein